VAQFEREFNVAVSWWPFELHPETPPEGRNVDEILQRTGRGREYSEHLNAYAAESGINLPSNRWIVNSHRALELAEFARDRGRFTEVHEALFRAYFEDRRDINDIDVLLEIAGTCGLDPDEFGFEILLGRYAELIDRTTALARQKGVTSTPTIIIDDRVVITGAQDYLVYEDILKRLGATSR
jgi:predicted DsbA family dithiol-disulfide isomerase